MPEYRRDCNVYDKSIAISIHLASEVSHFAKLQKAGEAESDTNIDMILGDRFDKPAYELSSVEEANRFLSGLDEGVVAVALDPVVDDNRHTAKRCFDLQTLLTKYLVADD